MNERICGCSLSVLLLAAMSLGLAGSPGVAFADTVTFSGTVTYVGSHTGDSLFVVVVDTAGIADVTLLAIGVFAVGGPPVNQPYSLEFDNAAAGELLFVAGFLDVGGGGIEGVGGEDVFGWYGEGSAPVGILSASSQSGLDFALPRAEIHGTITFASGQSEAWVDVSHDPSCALEGFRPRQYQSSPGSYDINGIYPGTYCVSGGGQVPMGPNIRVCFGDPTCASPTLITLTASEVRNGVDLDYTLATPAERSTWGRMKSRYP